MTYACGNIECGAVFTYDRQSLGKHVPPNFCPHCGDEFAQDTDSLEDRGLTLGSYGS